MRKVAKSLLWLTMCTPLGVHAVGMGQIHTSSFLHQRFRAEIPLTLTPTEAEAEVAVRLASRRDFRKLGVERYGLLDSLRFEPVRRGSGWVVQVSSTEAIREPFLDFVVEVITKDSRAAREFTVLLDPADRERVGTIPESASEQVPTIARAESGFSQPVQQRGASGRSDGIALAPTASRDAYRGGGESYGPIRPNETLWVIAERVKPSQGVTTKQMAVILYQKNPQAFYGSVNSLRAGATLALPSYDELRELPSEQARTEFARLLKVGSRVAAGSQSSVSPVTGAAQQHPSSRLTLLAGERTARTTQPDGGPDAKADAALEVAESLAQENESLRSRVNVLEAEVEVLKKLVGVAKSASTVTAANPAAVGQAPTTSVNTPAAHTPVTTEVAPAGVPTTINDTTPLSTTPAPLVAPTNAVSQPASHDNGQAPNGVTPSGAGADQPSWWPWAVGGAALLIGVMAVGVARRKRADAADRLAQLEAPEMENANTDDLIVDPISAGYGDIKLNIVEHDVKEVSDVLADADLYLAYKRPKQAEYILRQALEHDPERDDYKLKLLAALCESKDRLGFESYVEQLLAEEKDKDQVFWNKVSALGRALCPDNPVFNPQLLDQIKTDALAAGATSLSRTDSGSVAGISTSQALEPVTPNTWETAGPVVAALNAQRTTGSSIEARSAETDQKPLDLGINTDAGVIPLELEDNNALDWSFDLLPTDTSEIDYPSEPLVSAFDTKNDGGTTLDSATVVAVAAEPESIFDRFGAMDQIETKLDLAQAYLEMNDIDATRTLLGEIFEAGNANQLERAHELLQRLDG